LETQISFCVVAHHTRREFAEKLSYPLDATIFIDEGNHGSNWNHRRALEWASQQSNRVVILEDDAIPVEGFAYLAGEWLTRFPKHIVSFYLGTGRPPQKQLEIAMRLIDSDKHRTDYITLKRLIHGVCYSIPPHHIERILNVWNQSKGADYAISDGYIGNVIYPCYSLVDHGDLPVVEFHPDRKARTERRHAWRLCKEGERWAGSQH